MVSRPLARYTPSRLYLSLMLFAFCGAIFSAWMGLHWPPSWIAAALFALSGVGLSLVTLRPAIEIHESHLVIGRMAIPWGEIKRIDQTGWNSPLAVYLTVRGEHRYMLLYPGDPESASSLLRHLRRFSHEALLDGIPHSEFWGKPLIAAEDGEVGTDAETLSAFDADGFESNAYSNNLDPEMNVPFDDELNPAKDLDPARMEPLARYPLLRAEDEEEVERMFQRLKSVGHLESKSSDEI